MWKKTIIATQRLCQRMYWQNGWLMYQGRHVITRETPISQGVYLSETESEAIVANPESVDHLTRQTLIRTPACLGIPLKGQILSTVTKVTRESFDDSNDPIYALQQNNVAAEQKVDIGFFLSARTGVCKHMAITAGLILENLVAQGILNGYARINRSSNTQHGHAWVRYTNSAGEPLIVDPALNYAGPVACTSDWDYRNPQID
ncbi:MAG: hypothetical protein ACOCWQ_04245 [Nanoarchaeota archaeon]